MLSIAQYAGAYGCYGRNTAAASDAGYLFGDAGKTAASVQVKTETESEEAVTSSSQAPAEAESATQTAPGGVAQLLPVAEAAPDATSKSIRDYHPVDDAGWVAGNRAPYLHLAQALTVRIASMLPP